MQYHQWAAQVLLEMIGWRDVGDGKAIKTLTKLLLRASTVWAAWIVAWATYMIAMMISTYDGLLSLVFQPIMAALASTLFVGAALLLGLIFRIPAIGRVWGSSWWWSASLAAGSLSMMCLGSTLGLTWVGHDPESGKSVTILNPVAAVGSYFLLIFSIANWPIPNRRWIAQLQQRWLRTSKIASTDTPRP